MSALTTVARRGRLRLPAMTIVPKRGPVIALGVILLIGLIGPFFVDDPQVGDPAAQLAGPSWNHLFGTDQYGFDILARVVCAIRLDVGVAIAASLLAVAIGMPLGALAGFRRGWPEQVLLRVTEGFQSFPALLLAIGVASALGASIANLVIVIAVVNAPVFLRLTRNAVLPLREADYVIMARVAGRGTAAILWHHMLPNVRSVIIAQFSVNCGWSILTMAGLSFIGVGPTLPTAEWGLMIQQGSEFLVTGQWWPSVFPGVAILITVLVLNEIADGLRVRKSSAKEAGR
ncbi:MAG TPA: ABC transporter permease [Conexibacter sp.]|nr:ABC transporter permease [Conexibacter sp.]